MFSYTIPQMLTVRLSLKLGCRLAVPISLGLCAISTMFTPWAAHLGWQYVVLMRLLNGLGASAIVPVLLSTIERWMRYDEISLGLTMAQLMNASFITLTPLISGYLAEIHWSYTFYVPAIFTIAFCFLWLLLIFDEPEMCHLLSEKELIHIMNEQDDNLNERCQSNNTMESSPDTNADEYQPVSWLSILRIPSFYAYIIIWCLTCSSYSGFLFLLPTYMEQFMDISVAQNGFYCFIIQLGNLVAVLWPHPLLNHLQRLGLSTTNSRRVSHLICCSMVAISWIYVGLFHHGQLFLLFINRCFHGGNEVIVVGSLMSNYAKANLSSIAFALMNTIGNLSIVFSSSLIGFVLDSTGQSRDGWTWIFVGLGSTQVLTWILFAYSINSDPIKFKGKVKDQSCC